MMRICLDTDEKYNYKCFYIINSESVQDIKEFKTGNIVKDWVVLTKHIIDNNDYDVIISNNIYDFLETKKDEYNILNLIEVNDKVNFVSNNMIDGLKKMFIDETWFFISKEEEYDEWDKIKKLLDE